jgi:hypothetical protein
MVLYRSAQPRWLARTAESRIYNEFFVAVNGGIVRGGYALKSQEFFFRRTESLHRLLLPSAVRGIALPVGGFDIDGIELIFSRVVNSRSAISHHQCSSPQGASDFETFGIAKAMP